MVDAIAFGSAVANSQSLANIMQQVASKTGGTFVSAANSATLNQVFSQFATKIQVVSTTVTETTTTSTLAIIKGNAVDNHRIKTVRYRYKEDAAGGYTGPFTQPITPNIASLFEIQVSGFGLPDGRYTFEVTAADESDNEDTRSVTFTLDSTKPSTDLRVYDDSGSIRLSGLANATASPRGRRTRITRVAVSVDDGKTYGSAVTSGDGIDNDSDGVVDEESPDSTNQNEDWSTVFPQADARGDFWADDPAGRPGVFEPGVDEVFLMSVTDSVPFVKYTAANMVLYQGKTAGVQTTIGSELFPLIDEDVGTGALTDTLARWTFYLPPPGQPTLNVKLRVHDEAGNVLETSVTIQISPQISVAVTNVAPAQVPAPSDTIAVFGLDISDPTAGGRLVSVQVAFDNLGGFDSTDLAALANDTTGGVQLYADNGIVSGSLDPLDQRLTLGGVPAWSGNETVGLVLSTSESVPINNTGNDAGPDFFVVIKTSSSAAFRDRARFRIPRGGIAFNNAQISPAADVRTDTIVVQMPVGVTRLIEADTRIRESSGYLPVFGLNAKDGTPGPFLKKVTLTVEDLGGFTPSDLHADSGFSIARDNGFDTGVFDTGDAILSHATPLVWDGFGATYRATLTLSAATDSSVPDSDGNDLAGSDFFILMRTSATFGAGDAFRVRMISDDLVFGDTINTDAPVTRGFATARITSVSDFTKPAMTINFPKVNIELTNNADAAAISPTAEVVFVVDITGSMGFAITGVKNNVTSFATQILNAGIPLNLGLVTFKDVDVDNPAVVNYGITADINTFRNNVSQLTASGGGDLPESSLEGTLEALNLATPGAKRFFVLITDAESKNFGHEPTGKVRIQTVSDSLVRAGVTLFLVTDTAGLAGQSELFPLAFNTGGQIMELDTTASSFAPLLNSVAATIISLIGNENRLARIEGISTDVSTVTNIRYRYKEGTGAFSGSYAVSPLVPSDSVNFKIQVSSLGLPDGDYTFEVVAVDGNGNEETRTAIFTLDSTRPKTTVTVYDDSGSIRITGLADATASPRGLLSSIQSVLVSMDGGLNYSKAVLSGDGADNDSDGLRDEESPDSTNANDDWGSFFAQAGSRGDFWADDPGGKAGVYERGIDEVFLMSVTDSVPFVKYTGSNQVLSEGKTSGIQTPIGAELFPLIDEDMARGTLGETQAQWTFYVDPTAQVSALTIKLRVVDEATNIHETTFLIQVSPRIAVSISNLTPAQVPAPSDTVAVFALDITDPTSGGRLTAVQIAFDNLGGFDSTDLAALANDTTGGLQFYRDDGPIEGVFDALDRRIHLAGVPAWTAAETATLYLSVSETVPAANTLSNLGPDFYIALKTSATAAFRDRARLRIPAGGLVFNNAQTLPAYEVRTDTISVQMPVTVADMLGGDTQILNSSGFFPVFGLNTRDGTSGPFLKKLTVTIDDLGGFTPADLHADSGLAIARDNGLVTGAFDSSDAILPDASPLAWDGFGNTYRATLTLSVYGDTSVPDTDANDFAGSDFFLVLQTSATIGSGDAFRVRIASDGLVFADTGNTDIPVTRGYASARITSVSDYVAPVVAAVLQKRPALDTTGAAVFIDRSLDSGAFVNSLDSIAVSLTDAGAGISTALSNPSTLRVFLDRNANRQFEPAELVFTIHLPADTTPFNLGRRTDGAEDGLYAVVVRAVDKAGNVTEDTRIVVYDTVKPKVARYLITHGVSAAAVEDTLTAGAAFGDSVTFVGVDLNDTNTGPAGDTADLTAYGETTTVRLINPTGASIGAFVYNDGPDTLGRALDGASALSLTSQSGVYTLAVQAIDRAGNFMAETTTFVFDKDNPQARITTPAQNAQFNAGPIAVTGVATDTTGIVAKVFVRVYLPGADFGASETVARMDSAASGTASWLGTINFTRLGDTLGDWRIVAYAVDAAGNTSPTSDTLVIRYDTGIVDVTPPQISDATVDPGVFGANGATIKYVLGESVDTALVVIQGSNGAFIDTAPTGGAAQVAGQNAIVWDGKDVSENPVPDDTYSFEIRVTDKGGNRAAVTVKGVKDVVPPVVTLTQSPIPNPFSPAVTSGEDDVTAIRYTTTGAVFSRVDIYSKATGVLVTGKPIFTATGDGTDTRVVWDGSGQPDGLYRVLVTAVDGNGLTAEVSSEVEIDNTPFALTGVTITPTKLSPENADGVNDFASISYAVGGVKDSASIRFQVFAGASDTVPVYTDSVTLFVFPAVRTFTFRGKNDAGAILSPSATRTYFWKITAVDGTNGQVLTAGGDVLIDNSRPLPPQIFAADNLTARSAGQLVSGAAEPGALVTLNANGADVGSIQADSVTGLWSTTLTLGDGSHIVYATASDTVGNKSARSGLQVTLKGVGPAGVAIGPESGGDTVLPRVSKAVVIVRGDVIDTQTRVVIRGGGLEDTLTIDTGATVGQRVTGAVHFSRFDTIAVATGAPGDSDANLASLEIRAEDQYVFYRIFTVAPVASVTAIQEELSKKASPLDAKSSFTANENILVLGRSAPVGTGGGLARVDVSVTSPNLVKTKLSTLDAGGYIDTNVTGGTFDTWQVRIPNNVVTGGGEGIFTVDVSAVDNIGNAQPLGKQTAQFIYDVTQPRLFSDPVTLTSGITIVYKKLSNKTLTNSDSTITQGIDSTIQVIVEDPVPAGLSATDVAGIR